jgi:hypothetical protein
LGKPTASEFHRILTSTGKLSEQRYSYMYELIYERIFLKRLNKMKQTFWMARGKYLEPRARFEFQRITGKAVQEVGLLLTDDGRIGASPDGILDWSHSVEIKCPAPWKHMQYAVMGPGADYHVQMQGQMYVGGFDCISFFSYCPGMPLHVHHIWPIEKIQSAMKEVMPRFVDELDEHEARARKLGEYDFEEIGIGEELETDNPLD